MNNKLHNYRTPLLMNGTFAILFGLFVIFVPTEESLTIVKYFGAVLIIGGVFAIVNAIQMKKKTHEYISSLVSSIISILLGLFIVIYTHKSLEQFAINMGIWAVILGLLHLIIAFSLPGTGPIKNIFIFYSIITLLFG